MTENPFHWPILKLHVNDGRQTSSESIDIDDASFNVDFIFSGEVGGAVERIR